MQDVTLVDSNFTLAFTRQEGQAIVAHEFGHSFGGLADEYQDDSILGNWKLQVGFAPNCDFTSACTKWQSITNSCVPVCTSSFLYRPFTASIMRYPDVFEDFNYMPVSQKELEKDINALLAGTESTFQPGNFSYLISILNNDGNLTLDDLSIIQQKTSSPIVQEGDYHVLIKDAIGNQLYDSNIGIPFGYLYTPSRTWFDANGSQIYFPDPDDYISDENISFTIPLPYFINANFIDFIDINEVVLLHIDVSQLQYDLSYSIGHGGWQGNSLSYVVNYQLVDQPVSKISGSSYISQLGVIK